MERDRTFFRISYRHKAHIERPNSRIVRVTRCGEDTWYMERMHHAPRVNQICMKCLSHETKWLRA